MTQASDRDSAGVTADDQTAGVDTRDLRGESDSIPLNDHKRIVEEAIKSRVNRLNAQKEKQLRQIASETIQAFREEHGLDDAALEEFGKWRAKKDSAAPELSKLQLQMAAIAKERDALAKQASEYASRYRETVTIGALRSAASEVALPKAVTQIVAVLKERVQLGDDGSPVIVDESGQQILDKTPADLVREYVADNPHLAPATSRPGSGSGTRPTTATPTNGDLRVVDAIAAYDALVSKR